MNLDLTEISLTFRKRISRDLARLFSTKSGCHDHTVRPYSSYFPQAVRSVLDLLSLLPEETNSVEVSNEQTDESSPEIASVPTPMSVENGNEQETDVLLSQPSATESDKLESSLTAEMHAGPIENATNNMGLLLEPLEKRRSARVCEPFSILLSHIQGIMDEHAKINQYSYRKLLLIASVT